jgi:predicted ribosomally synthesized peptide with nif11-like leader
VALQEKLNAAADADAVVAIAKEVGFMIFADELLKLQWAQRMEGQTEADGDELTDEELEGVAGGGVVWPGLCVGDLTNIPL